MLRGRKSFLKFLSTLIVLGVLVGAPGGERVQAAPGMNPQHTNVVISEFRTSGPGGTTDEFIEFFNPTMNPIDISGWGIMPSDQNRRMPPTPIYIFPSSPDHTILQSGQHYLVANTGFGGSVTPNGTYTYDVPDNGGIALIIPGVPPNPDVVVDSVGMSNGVPFVEGTPLPPLAGTADQSYERGPGGDLGNCTDTDHNSTDFILITPSNPQNLASAASTACTNPVQTISFTSTAPTSAKVGAASYSPVAIATSGLPVSPTIDASATSFCSISAGVVSFIGVGTCVIDANQAGDAPGPNHYYQAAVQVQQSFTVDKGNQTISFTSTAPANAKVGGAPYLVSATATSSLAVALSIAPSAAGVCTLSGGNVSFIAVGECVINATQVGDGNWNAAPPTQQAFSVAQGDQTITFGPAPTSPRVGGSYTPTASGGGSGNPVTITVDTSTSAICSISGGIVSFNAVGTCVVDANQAGNSNWNPGLAQQSFTISPTATATSTPGAPAHLVISEFRSRGPLGENDEFVEIYNPYAAPVNIGSWTIRTSSGCSTGTTVLVTIAASTILKPGQHYLVAATGSSAANEADRTFTPGIDDNGGVGLFNFAGTVQDMAGMCATTLYREGNFLTPLLQENELLNQSYERKPVGASSCYDTSDNARDFALVAPADPQNSASPIVMCAGVVAFTPTFTRTPIPTLTPTNAPTAVPGNVVLNEFLPHPRTDWNGDGTIDTGDEYIEIINMGTASVSVANWKLDNGAGSANSFTLPALTLLPRQIAVFYHADTGIGLSDVGGSVRLLKSDGHTADIFNYPLVTAADRTWCRLPDGNGEWGFVCTPTPGKPNEAIKSGTPGSGEAAGSICIKNSAPVTVLTAECSSPGGKMWGEVGNVETWLKTRLKFDVFVE
jgi:hypothetical protein